MMSYGVGEPARPNALTRLLEGMAEQFTVRCGEHAHPSPTEPTPRLAVALPQARTPGKAHRHVDRDHPRQTRHLAVVDERHESTAPRRYQSQLSADELAQLVLVAISGDLSGPAAVDADRGDILSHADSSPHPRTLIRVELSWSPQSPTT
ncbi:MAG: hypothetical protein JWN32_2353 [Solirubrobacterales bacterium]|jgi:hypothetical protein|nr:hypothetical protein [Solirubrobacterales bacterium]